MTQSIAVDGDTAVGQRDGSLSVMSYGGGVQSTAALVLAAQGVLPYRVFLFANVGHDSEHPDTLTYLNEVARPFAQAHGIELVELHRTMLRGPNRGQAVTLYQHLTRPGSRSIPIPVRMTNGAPGTRSCTADYKIQVVARELRRRGATPTRPATVALGISTDELERARPGTDPRTLVQHRVYPLLDLGMNRADCAQVISTAGLPVPPKSACWFCPFHDHETWRRLKRRTPGLFARACQLETTLNQRRHHLGRDNVWLTRHARPLATVIDDQLVLPGLDACDSGWCMT
jgi:3'-phosphoadenosine 5'-phosphosulfate sulfotransferase (PAPS reductase)/FAD synthetase